MKDGEKRVFWLLDPAAAGYGDNKGGNIHVTSFCLTTDYPARFSASHLFWKSPPHLSINCFVVVVLFLKNNLCCLLVFATKNPDWFRNPKSEVTLLENFMEGREI